MVYVAHDGTVGGKKSTVKWISDFFSAIYSFFALFFASILDPPKIENTQSSRRTYAQRNGGRSFKGGGSGGQRLGRSGGSNIRGVSNLQGACEARMGGG